MTRSIDSVIDLLPKLTAAERQEVIERCRAFNAVHGDQMPLQLVIPNREVHNEDASFVADVLVEVLQSEGFEFTQVPFLRKKRGYPTFAKQKVPGVMKFLRKHLKKKNTQRAMLVLGYRALLEQLAQMKLAPTSTTLMNHTHRVPAIIHGLFPGYAANGLLELVMRQDK